MKRNYILPHDINSFFLAGMDRVIPPFVTPNGLMLNVGAGDKVIDNCLPIDLPDWDADTDPLPYKDGTVHVIQAYHFLEHVQDPVKVLLDFQRVLAPGGVVNICVPYYSSEAAHQDLDHKHFFTEGSWKNLFKNTYYNKNQIEWKFAIGMNIIIGVVERNLCLLTQLIKE